MTFKLFPAFMSREWDWKPIYFTATQSIPTASIVLKEVDFYLRWLVAKIQSEINKGDQKKAIGDV